MHVRKREREREREMSTCCVRASVEGESTVSIDYVQWGVKETCKLTLVRGQ